MSRTITYDRANDRLVFLMGAPDKAYWEELWSERLTRETIARGDRFVVKETSGVLRPGAKVVDAGCGIGATVHGLAAAGFDAHGVDYAEATVAGIRALHPQLKVQVADVRALPFGDGELDGLWSLGVIEHFYEGYDQLITEAHRVLRASGYLFLTVPTISPLKAFRIRHGEYRDYASPDREHFFQFAFRKQQVATQVTRQGFRLVRGFGRSGSFGLSEDLGTSARMILPSPSNSALWARAWWRAADKLLTPLSFHTYYFLFQKEPLQSSPRAATGTSNA